MEMTKVFLLWVPQKSDNVELFFFVCISPVNSIFVHLIIYSVIE